MHSDQSVMPTYWVNLRERDDWLLINVEGRKLEIIMTVTENRMVCLTVAGYHAGESRFVGENHNVLSVKVEPIPKNLQGAYSTLIDNAMPPQLRGLPVAFL
jgi:hypothetical protein